jgi:O-antigen ligase
MRLSTPINIYTFLFILYGSFSLLYSPNYLEGLRIIASTAALFLFFIIIVNFVNKVSQLKNIINLLALINIGMAFLIIFQLLFENVLYFGSATVQTESGDKIWRAAGTFEDPNHTAVFMMIGVLFSAAVLFFSNESKKMKLFHSISIFIAIIGIIATFSRTGWVALAVGAFSLLFFFRSLKIMLYVMLSLTLFFIGFILFTPYGDFLVERGFSIFDFMGDISIRTRIFMIFSSFWMWMDNPLFGVGLKSYSLYYDFYHHPEIPQIMLYMKESHTLWLTLLAEVGLIGFFIVLFWFKRVFSDLFQLLKKFTDKYINSVIIGAIANFIALNTVFLFYGFLFPHSNILWLVFGFIYTLLLNQNKFCEGDHKKISIQTIN